MAITVRTLVRTCRRWPSGLRRTLVVALAATLALGSLVATAPTAYAAVTEIRAALKVGADLPSPLVAWGTNVVAGLNRSTNTGATWTTDGTLTTMQESGTWLAGISGIMYGITGANEAVTYNTGSGAATTSAALPVQPWSQMNGTWVLSPTVSGGTAYNYATQSLVGVIPASGSYVFGSLSAKLAPSNALVWKATSTDLHTIFSVASSPTSAAGAWGTIDGVKDWAVNGSQLIYTLDTGTGLQVCSRPLSNLAAAPSCLMAWAGSHGDYATDVYAVGSSAFVRVLNGTDVSSWYLWNGATVVGVQVPTGSTIDSPFWGDTFVVVRDADSVPSLRKVNDNGTLGVVVPNPATAVSAIEGLAVAPGRIIGADNSDASNQTFPAWSRTVSGSAFGAETALPKRASGVATSARRTAISSRDGLSLYDGSTATHLFSDAHLGELSGPYVSQPLLDSSFAPYVLVSKVDGTEVGTFPTHDGVLFGSRYLSFTADANPAGATTVAITDLTGAAGRTVALAAGSAACISWTAWNDVVAATCNNGHAVRAYNLSSGALVTAQSSTEALLSIKELGDGYGIVYGTNGYQLWTFATNQLSQLVDCLSWTVSDGVGHIGCSSNSELIWRDYSSLSTSAARVLGWVAPPSFSTTATTWTPEIDVSKPTGAGTLVIKQGATIVRELTVPASSDGSVRGVAWDGKNTAGTLVSGTFTVTLVVSGADGSGPVVATDGTSPTITVTRSMPGSFSALTPTRLLDTRSAVGVTTTTPIAANGVVDLQVTGRGNVPLTGVGAVILNVTVVTPTRQGYLTVYPTGGAAPTASNVNFTPGQVVPNLVVAKVGTGGRVSLQNASLGATHVVADVAGYFLDGTVIDPGGLSAVTPSRLLDTRNTGVMTAGGSVKVQAAGVGGVPASNVAAVVVNLTAVTPTAPGFLTAYPTGGVVPNASNVNFSAGQVVPNLAFVKLGADGSFTIKNSSGGTTHVVADVAGYVLAGVPTGPGMFVALAPTRVLDTRPAYGGSGAVAANTARTLTMTGAGGVPATGVSGVVLNVTAVSSAAGFLTVYPADVSAPNASNVNFTAGQVVPNLVAVKTSASGQVNIKNSSVGSTNVIADVAGYFTG